MPQSTYLAILDAVCERVRRLNLAAMPDEHVMTVKVFVPEVIEALPGLPAVLIGPPARQAVTAQGGTNERDDIGYGVQITLFAEDAQENGEGLRFDRHLLWQQRIRQALAPCALPEAGGVFTSRLESQMAIDPLPWKQRNLWSGTLVIRFFAREERIAN